MLAAGRAQLPPVQAASAPPTANGRPGGPGTKRRVPVLLAAPEAQAGSQRGG